MMRKRFVVAKGVLDPLSVVGLAFCDGLTTAVILQVDTAHISTEVANAMRAAVADLHPVRLARLSPGFCPKA